MIITPQSPEEPHVKGGMATLAKHGVAHYQMMGRLSVAKRRQNREFSAARQVAAQAVVDRFGVLMVYPIKMEANDPINP